jgi:two-component system, sensor histidine kinase and response regulator
MDIRMPVMDGFEATRRILSGPGLQNVPIVAISAHCDGDWADRAREAGCVECIKKPIDMSVLDDVMQRFMGSC